MSGSVSVSSAVASYCVESTALDDSTADEVRRHLLDWIGLVIGGREHANSSACVIKGVESLTRDKVTEGVPTGRVLPSDLAALLAGTFAHSLDYDDTHLESSLHPGAPVIAATLPVAQQEGAEAQELLAAISLGYDVTCALGRAINPDSHYAKGFHLTATCGSFGAAAAVGSLLKMDLDTFEDAFGVVGSQAAGSLQFLENGAWNKRLHPGLAAQRGIQAATLASTGFRGAAEPITGKFGFLNAYSDDPHPDELSQIEAGEAVSATGLKPYPCCRYIHSAIDALLDLSESIKKEVVSVTIDLPSPGVRLTGEPIKRKRRPKNFVDCQFSTPFTAALALTEGSATLGAFLKAQKRLGDPDLHNLMDRVNVISTDRTNDPFPTRWSAHIVVDAGIRHERFVKQPLGEPEQPISDSALESKIEELVAATPFESKSEEFTETVLSLGEESSMADLLYAIDC